MLRPNFTFFGYRYVKIEGIAKPDPKDYTALVIYSDIPQTGTMTTGHSLVNRLISNAEWGLRSNFVDVPMDCPQRDERMGWTGDAQVFSATACFQHDCYAFYRKFLHDIYSEQLMRDGMVPDVVPAFDQTGCSCGWGDAAVIIPWNLYRFYGDITILEEQYPSMKAWVDYISRVDGKDHGWRRAFHYGDWLALDHPSGRTDELVGGTDAAFIADVYYRLSAGILSETAKLLGHLDDAEYYRQLHDRLGEDIRKEYYSETGRCCIDTQTAAILTIRDGLCEDRERAIEQLLRLLKIRGGKLATGFIGTPFLNLILSECGESEMAYKLLLNEEYPGWLYCVKMGATTIWERWNSIEPDGKISSTGMNSLNHYSYGSILEWLWRCAAGLQCVSPGFREVAIRPELNVKLSLMDAEYISPMGTYRIFWKVHSNTRVTIRVSIPFGAKAKVYLPLADLEQLSQTKNPMTSCIQDGACMLHQGQYEITYDTVRPIHEPATAQKPVVELLSDPISRDIVLRNLADIGLPRQYLGLSLERMLHEMHVSNASTLIACINEELSQKCSV